MFRKIDILKRGLRPPFKINLLSTESCGKKGPKWKVGVILSGCGVFDGTEVHEAASTLIHMSRKRMEPVFYAPCLLQTEVINHSTGEKTADARSMLIESARIARGKVLPLHELKPSDADALIFPGGFGVAKNLSNFASAAASCALNIDICRVIQEFHAFRRPMGFMCISSILAARMIPKVKVTLGTKGEGYGENPDDWPHKEVIDAARIMGANVELQDVTGITIDRDNLIVSTPAFMYKGTYYEIYLGIGKLIDTLDCLLKFVAECG